jgi:N utilization substance protein A
MALFDLKVINSVLDELEADRGVSRTKVLEAIEMALAAAYKKEYGKRGQIVRARFNIDSGDLEFNQVKIVVDESVVRVVPEDQDDEPEEGDERPRYNPEHDIMIDVAQRIKKGAQLDDEIEFPLESKDDFGRIAAQTAKQVILQKIREAERASVMSEFGARQGDVVSGHVQRFERGMLHVDLGRAVGFIPYEEQIPGERYRQGERIRALLLEVDENARGSFLKLSRAHANFLVQLFALEAPELANGTVEVKAIAREAGSRSKIAVASVDDHVDPVGAMVGQRGVRVSTVTSELGGEKIDIIEYEEDPAAFIASALSPAEVLRVELNEADKKATVYVMHDQQSLAIGRGGQNVRLAAKLTGWSIDIVSEGGPVEEEAGEADSEQLTANSTDEIADAPAEATPAAEPESAE